VSNLSRPRATKREYSGDESYIVNLSWGGHIIKLTVTVGCMFCSMCRNKTFERWFFTLIHAYV